MAAGGRFGDAAGGRSSRQRSPMGGRSAPPLRPPRGRSLSSPGGFSAARAAMTRCAHGRLAQRLRAGRAVDAMRVVRKCNGGRRMAAATVLQRAAPAAAGCDRPERNTRTWSGQRCVWPPRRHAAVEERCDLPFGKSRACARAPSASCVKGVRTTLYSM